MTTTGFIGLGAMGQPMAANLVRKGHDLIVYDIAQDRTPPCCAISAHRSPVLSRRSPKRPVSS